MDDQLEELAYFSLELLLGHFLIIAKNGGEVKAGRVPDAAGVRDRQYLSQVCASYCRVPRSLSCPSPVKKFVVRGLGWIAYLPEMAVRLLESNCSNASQGKQAS